MLGELAAQWFDPTGIKPRAETEAFAAAVAGLGGVLAGDESGVGVNIASQAGRNAAANNYLNHVERGQLVVGGGNARLVYENLAGTDEATYRLKTDLVIYRRVTGASIKSLMDPRTVSCTDHSAQAWPQSRWAEGNYLPVKQEMDALLAACETKVVASLDELLRD